MADIHIWGTKPYKTPRLDYPDTLNEAPPQNSGITFYQWGVTTRPSRNYTLTRGTTTWPSWNYVLALRHHHVNLVELRPDLEAPPWTLTLRFMELGSIIEAPLWTPLRRAHEIMSIWWGTTMSPTTRVMGLCPTQTLLTHNQPIMKFLWIPLTCHLVYMTNHQSYIMPSLSLFH